MMFSRDRIEAALRAQGHGEDKIRAIMAAADQMKAAGLIRTNGGRMGLTNTGRNALQTLRAEGRIPQR